MKEIDHIFDKIADYVIGQIKSKKALDLANEIKLLERGDCGSCQRWMTNSCKPEKEMGQFKHMNSSICELFAQTSSAAKFIDKNKQELAELLGFNKTL